jgi:FixJ family two-component response regulator
MKAGAVDFLTKPVKREALFSAVVRAAKVDALSRQKRDESKSIGDRLATLTHREREVLEYVIAGRLNKQIAASLGTVEKTVKVHRGRMMAKLGVKSVADLVRSQIRQELSRPKARLTASVCRPFGQLDGLVRLPETRADVAKSSHKGCHS